MAFTQSLPVAAGDLEVLNVGEHVISAEAISAIGRLRGLKQLQCQACSIMNCGDVLWRLPLMHLTHLDLSWADLVRRHRREDGPTPGRSDGIPKPPLVPKQHARTSAPAPFRHMASLKYLNLNFTKNVTAELLQALKQRAAPKLEHLLMCHTPGLTGAACTEVLQAAPQLRTLALAQLQVKGGGAPLCAAIAQMRGLQELWLPGCRLASLPLIPASLPSASPVESAEAAAAAGGSSTSTNSSGSGDASSDGASVAECAQVSHRQCSACLAAATRALPDAGHSDDCKRGMLINCMPPVSAMTSFPTSIGQPSSSSRLGSATSMATSRPEADGLGWRSLLASLPRLRVLNVSNTDICESLLAPMSQLHCLRHLQMRFCPRLTDSGLAQLASHCSALQSLEVQVFAQRNVKLSANARPIVDALCCLLRTLSMLGVGTPAGL